MSHAKLSSWVQTVGICLPGGGRFPSQPASPCSAMPHLFPEGSPHPSGQVLRRLRADWATAAGGLPMARAHPTPLHTCQLPVNGFLTQLCSLAQQVFPEYKCHVSGKGETRINPSPSLPLKKSQADLEIIREPCNKEDEGSK